MIIRIYYLYLLLFITHLPLIAIPTCHIFFEQPDTRSHVYRIPDYNAHYHHHSYETKENLFVYSSGQLQHYFDCNHYLEKDILSQNVLYISDEFVQLAKTYPNYEQSVTTLHLETVKNSIVGIGVITHALSKLVSIPAECAFLYATDTDHYYIRKNEIINQLKTIVDGTFKYLYTTQKRDIIKQGTSIITEGMLLTKIFIFAHNLSKNLLPLTKNYFEYVTTKEPVFCLADGTMIKVAIPKNINTKPLNDTILKIESSQLLSQNIGQHTSTISHTIQEIFTAIAEIEPNRIHHILTPTTEKHAWCKVCKNPLDWEEVKNIIAKVMLEGDIKQKKHGYEKIFTINKENIVVRYIYKSDGTLSISNAWVII